MSDDTRETIPITSPLAVLTTRTTQEHIMATHSTTDLKPGEIVQHPEHGYGVVLKNFPGVPTIYFAGEHGYENTTRRFTGWERAESTPPAVEQDASEDEASEYGVSATKFKCPWCDEEVSVILRHFRHQDGRVAASVYSHVSHTCQPAQPAQPDEPTEFGARVTVTLPDGTREKWLRSEVNTNEAWRAENGSEIGWFSATTWDNVIERGTVTLGWDDGEQP